MPNPKRCVQSNYSTVAHLVVYKQTTPERINIKHSECNYTYEHTERSICLILFVPRFHPLSQSRLVEYQHTTHIVQH